MDTNKRSGGYQGSVGRSDQLLSDKSGTLTEDIQELGSAAKEVVKDTISKVRDGASDVAGRVYDSASDAASRVRDSASDVAGRVYDSAADYSKMGRDKAVAFEHRIEGYVRDQPLKSMLIAAGVGLFLGYAFCRR